jgi:hypothetical protein
MGCSRCWQPAFNDLLVGSYHLPVSPANLISVATCSLCNFFLADRFAFEMHHPLTTRNRFSSSGYFADHLLQAITVRSISADRKSQRLAISVRQHLIRGDYHDGGPDQS